MPETDYFSNPPPRRFGSLALLQEPEGHFAVIQRSYWTEVSRWGLPGGSAAPNELPRRAMCRNIAEKLGLRVTAGHLLAIDHSTAWPGKHVEGVNFVYHVQVDEIPADVQLAHGYTELRWVTPDEAETLLIDHELLRVRQCLKALGSGSFSTELLMGNPMI